MGNPGSAFLSHSSREPDFQIAGLIATRLRAAGLDIWWDSDRLEGGNRFTAEIVEAIIRQYHFLFLLSGHSVRSPWCRRELVRAVDLGKTIVPITMEDVAPADTPLELAGLQYVDLRRGLDEAMPALSRAVGLGLAEAYEPSDDPFARDRRLIHAVAEQLNYGKTFTDAANLVRLLSNIGVRCSATERARQLFANMCGVHNYRGGRIDYDKVAESLLWGWAVDPRS
ncbi:MAG: toll/interleukin-1 receptor domain-containing protein [Bryobacteraceae bacterium]